MTYDGRTLYQVERDYILSALDACGGNRALCAKRLAISIRSLRYRLRTYEADGAVLPPCAPGFGRAA